MKIVIEDLCKNFSGQQVLEGISLELKGGLVYGLTGKNGSGKTMLMRAVAGLIVPTRGRVIIDGSVLGKDISFPKSIGILIENPGFIPGCSGFKNLKFLAEIQNNISDEEIEKTMIRVGLDPLDKKSFRKYSLGMKQKLGIAAAIMENPKILILDEPFNALDEETAGVIREIIKDAKNEDRIIILACHDKEEMESLCDVIFEIKAGKITGVTGSDSHG